MKTAQISEFKICVEQIRSIAEEYFTSSQIQNRVASPDIKTQIEQNVYTFISRLILLRCCHEQTLIREALFQKIAASPEDARNRCKRAFGKLQILFPRLKSEIKIDDSFFPPGEVIEQIIEIIGKLPNEIFLQDDVLGWFYHYYVHKDRRSYKKIKGSGTKSPKNAQYLSLLNTIYTPRWVIEFLVDNSLGQTYYKNNPASQLSEQWTSYLSSSLPLEFSLNFELRSLKILDPACGAGNFLNVVYRRLFSMYRDQYPNHSIPQIVDSILRNNLFGVEINPRAAELCAISLYLITCNILKQEGPAAIARFKFPGVNIWLPKPIHTENSSILENPQATELGALITKIEGNPSWNISSTIWEISPETLKPFSVFLSEKFEIILTNPPFGRSVDSIKDIIQKEYPASYIDLIAMFIEMALRKISQSGIIGMITDGSFCHLSTLSNFRREILLKKSAIRFLGYPGKGTLPQAGNNPVIFLLQPREEKDPISTGVFADGTGKTEENTLNFLELIQFAREKNQTDNKFGRWVFRRQDFFTQLPGAVLDFTLDEALLPLISWWSQYPLLDKSIESDETSKNNMETPQLARVFQGISTGNNDIFLRYWFEVPVTQIRPAEQINSLSEVPIARDTPYVPYSKGGGDVQYYLNNGYILWWNQAALKAMEENSKQKASRSPSFVPRNISLMGTGDIHWSLHARSRSRFCISQTGILNDVASMSIKILPNENNPIAKIDKFALCAFLNSLFGSFFGIAQSKDRKWQVGNIARFPIPTDILIKYQEKLRALAQESFLLRREWDTGYPFSPLFTKTHIEQVLIKNEFHPTTGHPFTKEYFVSEGETAQKIRNTPIENDSKGLTAVLHTLKIRFEMLTDRLQAIDREINAIILNNFPESQREGIWNSLERYGKIALDTTDLGYWEDEKKWIQDYVMTKIIQYIKHNPREFAIISPTDNGLIDAIQNAIIHDFSSKNPAALFQEFSSKLGMEISNWVKNACFTYHCERFGNRPILWHWLSDSKKPISAQFHIFLDYLRLTTATIPDLVKELELGREHSNNEKNLNELNSFLNNLRTIHSGFDAFPTANQISGERSITGQGSDMALEWVFSTAFETIKTGYHPDPKNGVLVNILPLCIEVPSYPNLFPTGTITRILKKVESLDQIRWQNRKSTNSDESSGDEENEEE
jgi:hypothetical protein